MSQKKSQAPNQRNAFEYKIKEGRRQEESWRLGNEGRIDRRKKVRKEKKGKNGGRGRKEKFQRTYLEEWTELYT